MGWLQYDLLRIKLTVLNAQLFSNKMFTLFSFILLMCSIFFIQIHPKSVWYYFIAGFFMYSMLDLIVKKTVIKYYIDDVMKKLNSMKKDLYEHN